MFIVIIKIVVVRSAHALTTLTSNHFLKCLFIFIFFSKGGGKHGSRDLINEADNIPLA